MSVPATAMKVVSTWLTELVDHASSSTNRERNEVDGPLSKQLDAVGELVPLLRQGEARAARYALWLFGQGDGAASQAAHELADG